MREHIFEATPSEVEALLGASGVAVSGDDLARRAVTRTISAGEKPPARLGEDEGPPPPDDWLPPAVARVNRALMLAMSVEYPAPGEDFKEAAAAPTLKGLAASRGSYEGRACVVQGPDDFAKLRPGDILVAPFTTTAYNVVLPLLGGVVTDKGGVLSHAAIVAREYAIPAIVNASNATSVIVDGSRIKIDGAAGTVELVAPAPRATEKQSVSLNAR
jgi:pyruvate,water dikinase